MKITPKVSVLSVSYNHEKYIGECITSVFNQKDWENNIEMIIIDDGSSDKTCEIIEEIIKDKSYNIKLIRDEHRGIDYLNSRLNEAIKISTGEYIMFTSSDDGFLPNRFFDHITKMMNDKSLTVCISPGVNIRQNGRKTIAIGKKTKKALSTNNIDKVLNHLENDVPELYAQGMTFKGNFLREKIKLDEKILADDWQLNILIFQQLKKLSLNYGYINKVVFFRNIHTSNTSLNFPVHYKRISEMAKIYADNPNWTIFYFVIYSLLNALKNLKFKRFITILIFLIKK
jgi:alpha-1,3-rhamnosyltransferase